MRFLLTIMILFIYGQGYAQEEVVHDTSLVGVRNFQSPAISEYKSDPVFQYDNVIAPPKTLWQRFWEWVWGKLASVFSTEAGQNTFITIMIVLSIAILVFFILKITGMNVMGLFSKKNREDALDYSVMEDDIHAINFNEDIERAIADKNFRFAVRLLYLLTLKNLTDAGLINWQVNKTNIAYVEELQGSTNQAGFRNLTVQFEKNWYGDLPINEKEFQSVWNLFNQFNKKLS